MFQTRIRILSWLFAAGFLIVLGRLAQLQLLESEYYRGKGERRLSQLVAVPPSRGKIVDRQGQILAEDRPSFDLWLVPARVELRQRKKVVVSQLGALTPLHLVQIAQAHGEKRTLLRKLAWRDLAAASPLVHQLATLLKKPPATVARAVLHSALRRRPYSEQTLTQPRPLFTNVKADAFLKIKQARQNADSDDALAAIQPRVGTRRAYYGGADMGHLVGYVGNLTEKEYRELRGYWDEDGKRRRGTGVVKHRNHVFFALAPAGDEAHIIRLRMSRRGGRVVRASGYFSNEMVGRYGVEQYYNQRLRGRHRLQHLRLQRAYPGGPRILRSVGAPVKRITGKPIALTVDLAMQQAVRRILRAELNFLRRERGRVFEGMCLLMDARNGRIYALVSEPGYDSATFRKDFEALKADPRKPFLNKAISGQYEPGSIIKPIFALHALNRGVITTESTFRCDGALSLTNRYTGKSHDFICMRRTRHGDMNVTEALCVSCNVFFYQTGEALGSRELYIAAASLGLGRRSGIDLAAEAPGHLAANAFLKKNWGLGQTYHFAIGQVSVTVTPLQIAVAFAAIANGGKIVQPHVRHDSTLDKPAAEIALRPEALAAVRMGLWEVVQGERGTGKRARIPHMEIAGKTGSAEWRKGRDTHAWFACYAPFDLPEVVCVVLVPEGGFGGHTAAPIARRILMKYFDIKEEGGVG